MLGAHLLGAQAGNLGIPDQVQPGGGIPFRVQNTQGHEDRHPVGPPLVAFSGIAFKTVGANGQETPGSADFMVAIGLKWVVGMAASSNGTPAPVPQIELRSIKSPEQ